MLGTVWAGRLRCKQQAGTQTPQLQPSRPPNVHTVAALLPDLTTPRISSRQISRMLLEEGSEEVLSAIGSRGEGKRDHRQLMAAVLLVQVHLTLTLALALALTLTLTLTLTLALALALALTLTLTLTLTLALALTLTLTLALALTLTPNQEPSNLEKIKAKRSATASATRCGERANPT